MQKLKSIFCVLFTLHEDGLFVKISSTVVCLSSTLGVFDSIKDRLWVLRLDQLLVHVSVDISLVTNNILDHDTSFKS